MPLALVRIDVHAEGSCGHSGALLRLSGWVLPGYDASLPGVTDDLADVEPGDGSTYDQALDLPGALEDGEDLRVAVHPLHGVVAGVAVAAQDLDGLSVT